MTEIICQYIVFCGPQRIPERVPGTHICGATVGTHICGAARRVMRAVARRTGLPRVSRAQGKVSLGSPQSVRGSIDANKSQLGVKGVEN